MRLIDADKLIELFSPFVSEDKKVAYQPRQLKIDDIKNAPTVEAIPVEWIKRWNGEMSYSENIIFVKSLDVRQLLEDWEKENETN